MMREVFSVGDKVCLDVQRNRNTRRQEKWEATMVTTIQHNTRSVVFEDYTAPPRLAVKSRIPKTSLKPTATSTKASSVGDELCISARQHFQSKREKGEVAVMNTDQHSGSSNVCSVPTRTAAAMEEEKKKMPCTNATKKWMPGRLVLDQCVSATFSGRRKLSGYRGTLHAESETLGHLKCQCDGTIILVLIDIVYYHGKRVECFCELSGKQTFEQVMDVFVDAVEAERDFWLATLVWAGERPAKPHVNRSEDIYSYVLDSLRNGELSKGDSPASLKYRLDTCQRCHSASTYDTMFAGSRNESPFQTAGRHTTVGKVQEQCCCPPTAYPTSDKDGVVHSDVALSGWKPNGGVQPDHDQPEEADFIIIDNMIHPAFVDNAMPCIAATSETTSFQGSVSANFAGASAGQSVACSNMPGTRQMEASSHHEDNTTDVRGGRDAECHELDMNYIQLREGVDFAATQKATCPAYLDNAMSRTEVTSGPMAFQGSTRAGFADTSSGLVAARSNIPGTTQLAASSRRGANAEYCNLDEQMMEWSTVAVSGGLKAIGHEELSEALQKVHVTTSKSSSKTTGASSSAGGSDDETTTLTGAKGKVYRLFKTYGFISVQHPISTSVYFSLRSFENGQHSSLLSSGLQLGDGVVLDAEVGPNDCEAKFRASRVARIKGGNAATPSDSSSPAPQTMVFTPLVNRTGAIETLKDEFGFIKLEKEQECAFFHAAEIERYLGTAVPALPEVLAVGDKIRFDADLNKNTTARAKWVVTTIHNIQNVPPCHSGSETEGSEIAPGTIIKRDGLIQMVKPEFGFIKFGTNYRDRAFFHLNNVVMPPRDTIKSLPDVFAINDRVHFEAKPSQKPSEKVKWQATTVWLSEFGPKGDGLDSADESGNEDDAFSPLPQSVEPSIVIFRGATGLVMDVTDYGATVEVQDQACSVGSLKVNFLSGVFYSDGVRCTKRLCEVLSSGDAVSLDFMVGSNGAHEEVRCDLVVFPDDCDVFFFRNREESGHRMSAHTSISDSINPHRRRSHHSPPSFPPTSSEASPSSPSGSIHGDRAIPNGICVGNSLATSALFSNDISENVLRRVARIMAEELHALQQQERLAKGLVRDVGTQTTERGGISEARIPPRAPSPNASEALSTVAWFTSPSQQKSSWELSEFPPLGESEAARQSVPMYDEEGIIELVREVYGFVRFKRYPSESACFLKDDEARYLGRRIRYATDVFKVGDVVRFDAIPNDRRNGAARWRITAFHYVHGVPGWASPKPCRDWYSDDSDKSRGLTGCDGVVDRLKSEYGFIRLGPHSAPAAFFRVGVLEQSIEKSVQDVSEVLAVGDLVRFDAELNLKENTSAKWWVTFIRPVSSSPPGAPSRDDVGKPSGKEGHRRSSRGPRDVGVRDSDEDDDDDSEVYQNSSLSAKGSEKKALPWSYARCAARAVADEGVSAANTSAPKMRPPPYPPATTTSTVSKMTSFLARPSILVYRSVRGIVKRVDSGAAVECEVRETAGPRRVKLGDDCSFYGNGVRGNGGVKALGEGDQLTLDYVVAADATSVKDADVHCYLAWQGERPCDVPHLSVALLSRALKAGCEKSSENTAKTDAALRNHRKAKETASGRGSSDSVSESSDSDDSDVVGDSRVAGDDTRK
ncbi:hypothetical protein HPB52_007211 [Rhipicephalus sanguineus]|uniref:Uncharacterized protein n=1 Tax=Rhipicephalus sanguineus TaxID=34632 RepID=A0A9D4QFT6_RHISA|nr:hypothetical protein HPB52_007211 [Rhipicephalus sanguineus]